MNSLLSFSLFHDRSFFLDEIVLSNLNTGFSNSSILLEGSDNYSKTIKLNTFTVIALALLVFVGSKVITAIFIIIGPDVVGQVLKGPFLIVEIFVNLILVLSNSELKSFVIIRFNLLNFCKN